MTAKARSYLFVPGDRPDRFEKALDSGADAVIIDLEDAVSPSDKNDARKAAQAFFASGGTALLRINALETHWAQDDLALCSTVGVAGIVIPKTQTKACIAKLRQYLRPDTPILPLIETAKGMVNAASIATEASVLRLLFGSVDFCLDLNLEEDSQVVNHYRSTLVLVSRAEDLDAPVLRATASAAKRMGFGGKLCIHPKQVAVVNSCFQATHKQIAWAHQVLKLAQSNAGAFQYEGKMVDAPVLALASKLIQSNN
jgi:citrate lyase subunit beta/citryl-CoA lyase